MGDKMDIGFDEKTFVKTIDGYKKIKDIMVGDRVLTKRGRYKEVYEVSAHEAEIIFTIVFDAENEVFPVVCGKDTQFLTFGMKSGDSLIMAKDMGAYNVVIGVNEYDEEKGYEMALRIKESPRTVYDLKVMDDESYTVTRYNVVVCE